MGIYFCTDDQGADAKAEEVEKKVQDEKNAEKREGKGENHLFDVVGARRTLKKGAPPVKSALLLPLLMHMHNTCCCWDHFLGLPSFPLLLFNIFSLFSCNICITNCCFYNNVISSSLSSCICTTPVVAGTISWAYLLFPLFLLILFLMHMLLFL